MSTRRTSRRALPPASVSGAAVAEDPVDSPPGASQPAKQSSTLLSRTTLAAASDPAPVPPVIPCAKGPIGSPPPTQPHYGQSETFPPLQEFLRMGSVNKFNNLKLVCRVYEPGSGVHAEKRVYFGKGDNYEKFLFEHFGTDNVVVKGNDGFELSSSQLHRVLAEIMAGESHPAVYFTVDSGTVILDVYKHAPKPQKGPSKRAPPELPAALNRVKQDLAASLCVQDPATGLYKLHGNAYLCTRSGLSC